MTSTAELRRPRILCVDDEPYVLEGLQDMLRKSFDVVTAPGAPAALDLLGEDATFAVILSDMQMPVMNGATFLAATRTKAPDAVRVLLTGRADVDAAIAAVNDGHIFRFLTKPCPRETLVRALVAAVGQHRLLVAERTLLRETLHAALDAMSQTLALTNPQAFARATRVKKRAGDLARRAELENVWEVEIAAMLSQLACATLDPDTAERYYYGQTLTEPQEVLVERLPDAAARLIRHIPRLENVHEILRHQNTPADGEAVPPIGARVLRIAHDFDVLESRGEPTELILATLRGREGDYDASLLDTFSELCGDTGTGRVIEIELEALEIGMTILQDVSTESGGLLLTRSQLVTMQVLDRVARFQGVPLRAPIRVLVGDDLGDEQWI